MGDGMNSNKMRIITAYDGKLHRGGRAKRARSTGDFQATSRVKSVWNRWRVVGSLRRDERGRYGGPGSGVRGLRRDLLVIALLGVSTLRAELEYTA
jgi:hypothetical protein